MNNEIEQLRAEIDLLRAKLTRKEGNGRKKTGAKPLTGTKQTAAQKAQLRKETDRIRAMWAGASTENTSLARAEWLTAQFAALPPEQQALRPLMKWLEMAAKW